MDENDVELVMDGVTEMVGVTEKIKAGYTSSVTAAAITSMRRTYRNWSAPGNSGAAVPDAAATRTWAWPEVCADVTQTIASSVAV